MDMDKLKAFLKWSTIINGVLLILSFLGFMLAGDLWGRIHVRLFNLNPDNFNMIIYFLLGIYKIFWIVFNTVPYAVLLILGKKSKIV